MAEILNIAGEGTLKTDIMYRANLSFAQLNEYLSFMEYIKLLKKEIEGSRVVYVATSKGRRYLDNFKAIKSLIKRGMW